jgi:alpha-1,2-mannosyltransferase
VSGRAARRAGLAAVALVLVLVAFRAAHRPGVDFAVFYRAGARFSSGADLYVPGEEYPFRYAPGVAALFAPFAQLPFSAAKALWAVLSAGLAFAAALAIDGRVGQRSALATPLAWLCLLSPLVQELAHGQVDLVVLTLALAAFALEDRRSDFAAGALVAGAAALKVAPAVLAVEWLLRRRWRCLAGVAAGAALLASALLPRYGLRGCWEQHVQWFATQAGDASVMIGSAENQSLWAMSRLAGLGSAGAVLACAGIIALALSAPSPSRRRLLLLASVPLVSAYGWPQLFVVALPLLAEVLAAAGGAAWVAGCAAAGVSLLGYDVAGQRVESWAESHRVLGALLLAVFLAGRFGGSGRERPSTTAGAR